MNAWTYISNTFEVITRNSYKLCDILLGDHVARATKKLAGTAGSAEGPLNRKFPAPATPLQGLDFLMARDATDGILCGHEAALRSRHSLPVSFSPHAAAGGAGV